MRYFIANTIIFFLIGILAGLVLLTPGYSFQYRAAAAEQVELTPKEFLIQEVRRQGLNEIDEAVLTAIVQCESSWSQVWERDYKGHKKGEIKISNGNIGLAQINIGAHREEYTRLGIDPADPFDNLSFAIILYKRNGVRDWEQWSGHCWKEILLADNISF